MPALPAFSSLYSKNHSAANCKVISEQFLKIDNATTDQGNFMTPKMVSQMLHIGINNTYKLFHLPDFPRIRISHQFLVKKEDLYSFLEKYKGSDILL